MAILTTECVLCFPNIFSPMFKSKDFQKEGDPKVYQITLLVPKSDTEGIAKINKEIDAAKAAGVEKGLWDAKSAPKKSPLRDGDTDDGARPEYAGHMFMICKQNDRPDGRFKPVALGRDAKVTTDTKLFYPGSIVRAEITAFPFNNKTKGIGFSFSVVMSIKDGERIGSGGSSDLSAFSDFAVQAESESFQSFATDGDLE